MKPIIELDKEKKSILVSMEDTRNDGKKIKITTHLRLHEVDKIDMAIQICEKEIKQYLENDNS
jgi:hypothetical protein